MKLMLPQNKEALTNMEQVLKYADNGFYLFTTESALMQKVVADELVGYNIAIWDYGSHNNEYYFGQLAEWAIGIK